MPTPPALSADQRRTAYQRSLELRQERAALKAALACGSLPLSKVLTLPSVRGMRIRQLLLALPGVAGRRADRALEYAGVKQTNTVAQCGPVQLEKLLQYLERLPK